MTHDEFEKHLPEWAVIIKKLYEEVKMERAGREKSMSSELVEKKVSTV